MPSGEKTPEKILEEARLFITNLPDKLPPKIAGLSRREYREREQEVG